MKPSLPFLVLVSLSCMACGTNQQRVSDEEVVRASSVPRPVYDRMVRDEPLSLPDIVSLSRAGVDDGVIIRYVNHRGLAYDLSQVDRDNLRRAGVSENVIHSLLATDTTGGPGSPNFVPSTPVPYDPGVGPAGLSGPR